jgi:ECF sigma factor
LLTLPPVSAVANRDLAAAKLAHAAPGQTLQATALVHEAYLRLVETRAQQRNAASHFFAAAAEAMRRILVDRARKKLTVKHGGKRVREPLDEANVMAPEVGQDLVGTRKRRNSSSCAFLPDSPRRRRPKPLAFRPGLRNAPGLMPAPFFSLS